jgi:hypothetical protein
MRYIECITKLLLPMALQGCAEGTISAPIHPEPSVAPSVPPVDEGALSIALEGRHVVKEIDAALEAFAIRMKGMMAPSFTFEDGHKASCGRIVDALRVYLEFSAHKHTALLTEKCAEARAMHPDYLPLWDSASGHLVKTLPKTSVFPNYAVYDFLGASTYILTDNIFGTDNNLAIVKSLKCASGQTDFCDALSSELTQELNTAVSRIRSKHDYLETNTKFLYFPVYFVLNHDAIPFKYRRFVVDLIKALVVYFETTPIAEQTPSDFFRRLNFSPADIASLKNIKDSVYDIVLTAKLM